MAKRKLSFFRRGSEDTEGKGSDSAAPAEEGSKQQASEGAPAPFDHAGDADTAEWTAPTGTRAGAAAPASDAEAAEFAAPAAGKKTEAAPAPKGDEGEWQAPQAAKSPKTEVQPTPPPQSAPA